MVPQTMLLWQVYHLAYSIKRQPHQTKSAHSVKLLQSPSPSFQGVLFFSSVQIQHSGRNSTEWEALTGRERPAISTALLPVTEVKKPAK